MSSEFVVSNGAGNGVTVTVTTPPLGPEITGDSDVLLSSSRPLVAPSTRIQRTPSQDSASGTPNMSRKEYMQEEIVSEDKVKVNAPQINVYTPPDLQAPIRSPPVLNDRNPVQRDHHLGHMVEHVIENGANLSHFAALAIVAMFFANIVPEFSTVYLLIMISLGSLALFRYLKL